MKRLVSLVLVLCLCLALCACGQKEYAYGESIEIGDIRFTPKFEGFFRILHNVEGEDYLTETEWLEFENPTWIDVYALQNQDQNPFKAGDGETMMTFSAEIENVVDSKEEIYFSYKMIIDYDNGIQYEIVPSLSEVGQKVSFTLDYEEWEDDGITFEPLGEKKACSRATIRVPEQLETETGKPLTVTYVINNKEYVYRLR